MMPFMRAPFPRGFPYSLPTKIVLFRDISIQERAKQQECGKKPGQTIGRDVIIGQPTTALDQWRGPDDATQSINLKIRCRRYCLHSQ